jgi:hypothetical protein
MEYVPGETLTQVWERVGGRIHHDQVLTWARELCRALDYLHRQNPPIIFRDLKPDNIMVLPDGRLKIIDFGIARHFKPGQTRDTIPLGTPGYASPEQHGQGQTDTRSDVYSLGAVLHQLLTGHDPSLAPMNFPQIQTLAPYVPQHVTAAIHQALNMNPDHRFASVAYFAAALGVPITGSAADASPISPTPPPKSSTPMLSWLVPGMLLILLLAGGAWAWRDRTTTSVTVPPPVVNTQVVTIMVTTVVDAPPPSESGAAGEAGGEVAEVTPAVPTEQPTDTPTPTSVPTAIATPVPMRPIVFDSTRDVPQAEIYIMNPDGTNQRRLTHNNVQDDEADLSPDGQWIAFSRETGNTREVWLMRSDGSNARSLVGGQNPDWSPDGRFLAYETPGTTPHIWIYDFDTGNSRPLTSGSRPYRAPDWSPDGQEIVAMSRIGNSWQIVIINTTTGAERQVTSDSGHKRFPAWSPDGRLIAYNTVDARSWPEDVWVIEPSATGARPITNGGNNGRPTWSPDSQFLVFNSYINQRWVLYQVDLNGQQGQQLTTAGSDQRANWSN